MPPMGDAYNMIVGLDYKNLKKMKEMAEEQVEYFKRAIQLREKEYEENESKNDMECNMCYEPEKYYHMRIKEKGIQIIRTNQTTIEGKPIHSKKLFYAIALYGFKPRKDLGKFDMYKKTYGMYEDITDAIKDYLGFCADLLNQNGYKMYEDLELFV